MIRKVAVLTIASSLLLSGAVGYAAESKQAGPAHQKAKRTAEQKQLQAERRANEAVMLDKLKTEAAKLGIPTEGKSAKELIAAMKDRRKALEAQKQQELLAKLRAEAVKYGIDPGDKNAKELERAIKAKKKEARQKKGEEKGQRKTK